MPITTAMSRGVVVLDEHLFNLAPLLQTKNIRVVKPRPSMTDEDIASSLAIRRILITKNTKDFEVLAIEFEFGVIACEHGPSEPEALANAISGALIKHRLWAIQVPFICTLLKDGSSTLKYLEG